MRLGMPRPAGGRSIGIVMVGVSRVSVLSFKCRGNASYYRPSATRTHHRRRRPRRADASINGVSFPLKQAVKRETAQRV